VYLIAVNEGATGTDIPRALAAFRSSVAESATGADAVVSRIVFVSLVLHSFIAKACEPTRERIVWIPIINYYKSPIRVRLIQYALNRLLHECYVAIKGQRYV
jgi:hypothetical protein